MAHARPGHRARCGGDDTGLGFGLVLDEMVLEDHLARDVVITLFILHGHGPHDLAMG